MGLIFVIRIIWFFLHFYGSTVWCLRTRKAADFHLPPAPNVGKKVSGKIDHFTFPPKNKVHRRARLGWNLWSLQEPVVINMPRFAVGNGMVIITGWKATIGSWCSKADVKMMDARIPILSVWPIVAEADGKSTSHTFGYMIQKYSKKVLSTKIHH